MFGELIGLWAAAVLAAMGSPEQRAAWSSSAPVAAP